MYRLPSVTMGLCTTAWLLGSQVSAIAQVTDDGTAGTVVTNLGTYTITGGTQELTTLFHSFEDFSPGTVPVLFQLDGTQSDVDLVLSRVTGNNASLIDSELSLLGGNTPDLFLINPNGITFGAGASLDIPGSLLVSTADSVIFADGQSFSSNNLSAPPTLTVSTPVGVQFGATAAAVVIEDSFLEIPEGKSFGLFAGDVYLNGAMIFAPSGAVFIGSVEADSQITLDGTLLADYANVSGFRDIFLDQGTTVEVSGDIGGRIQLQGGMVSLTEGTTLGADTYGAGQGGDITITGDVVSVDSSYIYTTTYGTGQGGNITITSDEVSIDNSDLSLGTYGAGQSGNITITGDVISVSSSNLYTDTYGSGQGGDITITGDIITINNSDLYSRPS